MASAHLYGEAFLEWEVEDGSPVIHTLAAPLFISPGQRFDYSRQALVFQSWNATMTARETFTLGGPVFEIQASVRFEDEPDALQALLVAGLESNATVTYYPTGLMGPEFPCLLLSAGGHPGMVHLVPDRERWAMGEWETTLRLRRVDGGDFSTLLAGDF